MPAETDGFIRPKADAAVGRKSVQRQGCCHSKHTRNCCVATGVLGAVVLALGIVVLVFGEQLLTKKILESMAITQGSDRYESWLNPPVTAYLTGYAFHVTNPEDVLRGAKPIVMEKGPYVYKSDTDKDSDSTLAWDDSDGTITYRPRKIYTYAPELSGEGLDPFNDYLTVPNIPLWTGLNSLRSKAGFAQDIGRGLITTNGRATPFVNVSFHGLLWGYDDDLPCLSLDRPSGCQAEGEDSPFSDDSDWEKRRKKRSLSGTTADAPEDSKYYGLARPSSEFVNCSCQWGLFRDRNITLREPVKFLTGITDLSQKGIITEFDGRKTLDWWKEDSVCDQVKGQDTSTLPPALTKETTLDIFISLMCRGIPVVYEKEVTHAGIRTLRFVPPPNAMGAHDDPNPDYRNPDNECYCLKDQNFRCFKSGVLNMEPCKRKTSAPLALSMPHFYMADKSFLEAVEGLSPEKDKHEFFMDVVPEFGFPLAIRPRFQLNVVIGSGIDPKWSVISGMRNEIVLPFLWAQDGFDEPSEEMASQIRFGLEAPQKLPFLASVALLVLGAVLLLSCLSYFLWQRTYRAKIRRQNGDFAMT